MLALSSTSASVTWVRPREATRSSMRLRIKRRIRKGLRLMRRSASGSQVICCSSATVYLSDKGARARILLQPGQDGQWPALVSRASQVGRWVHVAALWHTDHMERLSPTISQRRIPHSLDPLKPYAFHIALVVYWPILLYADARVQALAQQYLLGALTFAFLFVATRF